MDNNTRFTIEKFVNFFMTMEEKLPEQLVSSTRTILEYNNMVRVSMETFYPELNNIYAEEFKWTRFEMTPPTYLSEKHRFKFTENVFEISFIKLYPDIILDLNDKGNLKFSIPYFVDIYRFVRNNLDIIKSRLNGKNNAINFFINALYGCQLNEDSIIKFEDVNGKFSDFTSQFKNDFLSQIELIPELIAMDTDTFYFHNKYNESLELFMKRHSNFLKLLKYPYTFSGYPEIKVYFDSIKRLLIVDHQNIVIKNRLRKFK